MPIESISILYIGIGVLSAVLICLVVETVVEQTTNLFVGKKKDSLNRLRIEFGALKREVNELETKLDATSSKMKTEFEAISTKMTEVAHVLSVSSIANQEVSRDAWSRGNSESQSIQEDKSALINGQGQEESWSREDTVSETSIIPTIEQSTSEDSWTRDVNKNESVELKKSASRITAALSPGLVSKGDPAKKA